MKNINIVFIGVDIAKTKFDICVFNSNFSKSKYKTFTNDLVGFIEFNSFISEYDLVNVRIGFEATSTYMFNLQKNLDSLSVKYILINPKKLHHFIKYSLTESKTDKLDSYYISKYITTIPDKSFNSTFSQTKTLYKSYSAYLSLIIKTETHLKGLNDSILNDDFTSVTLRNEILLLKKNLLKTKTLALSDLIDTIRISMPEYDLIKSSLHGVGDKTLIAVLPLIYDISNDYSIKQLQSFIGLNPVYKESGKMFKSQRISKSGNSEARKMLYMSAVGSVRCNTELKLKYERLLTNGKPKRVALIAISAHIFRAIVIKLNHYKALNNATN